MNPLIWAFKHAPVKSGQEKLALQAVADAADRDGRMAYRAQSTLARHAMMSTRTMRRCLVELESRGLIARGDQSAVAHLPVDRRPIVYDVMVPVSAFSAVELREVNDFCIERGREPLSEANRPDLDPAPDVARRADHGVKRPKESGGTERPGGLEVRADSEVGEIATGRTCSPDRADYKSDNLPHDLPPTDDLPHAVSSLRSETAPAKPSEPAAKRGTRLAEDWQPDERLRDWFRSRPDLRHVDVLRQTEMFVNHFVAATGQNATKKDWGRAWQNWILRAAEHRGNGRAPHRTGATEEFMESVRERTGGLW